MDRMDTDENPVADLSTANQSSVNVAQHGLKTRVT